MEGVETSTDFPMVLLLNVILRVKLLVALTKVFVVTLIGIANASPVSTTQRVSIHLQKKNRIMILSV